jgi:hypothetical protein
MLTMRKWCLRFIGAALLVSTGFASQSEAEVNISVNLPAIRFAAPPSVVVIPGTYVYMVPDIDVDFLFFQGYWWRPHEGHWYRSKDYKGKWSYVAPSRIPPGLRDLPGDYRNRVTAEHKRIPQGQVKKNWKKWEKEKYWDGHGEHDGGGRSEQDRGDRGERNSGEHGKQKGRN